MAMRKKKNSGSWKGFVAGMGLAAIFGVMLVWAAAGPSGSKIREAFKLRMSVMADRADQLVNAWNRRQVPGRKDEETKPDEPRPEPAPARAPARTEPTERPVLAPVPSPSPPPPAAVPAAPVPSSPAATTATSPHDKDVSADDQRQLRELMQHLNQSH